MNAHIDPYQNQVILFADIKLYLKKKKLTFLLVTVAFFLLGLTFYVLKEVRFVAKATFKEAGVKSSPSSASLLKNLLLSTSSSHEGGVQAVSVMKSRVFLEGLIEELNLRVVNDHKFFMEKVSGRAIDRLQLLFNGPLEDVRVPSLICSSDFPEKRVRGTIIPLNETGFFLHIDGKTIPGSVGEWMSCEGGQIKIVALTDLRPRHFTILPMEEAVERINKRLKIKGKKDDPNILDLSFEHRDRFLAARFLNRLMTYYKEYLAEDSERISKEQLVFLSKRQEEIASSVEDDFEHHAHYLKDNLDARGYISIQDEIHVKEGLKKEIDQQLDQVDTLKASLEQVDFNHPISSIQDEKLSELIERWLKLHEESQTYLASKLKLQNSFQPRSKVTFRAPFLAEKNVMKVIDVDFLKNVLEERVRKPLSDLHHLTKLHNQIDSLIKTAGHKIAGDEDTLKEVVQLAGLDPSIDISKEHLERLNALVCLKLSGLKQRLFKLTPTALEHDHLNLETAKEMLFDYTHQLDTAELKTKQLEYCLQQIQNNTFEASVLPSFLSDSVTLEMITQAAKLQKQLKDSDYFSTKDHQRMGRSLKKEKNALFHHLSQIKNLLALEKELCLEKMGSLQDLMLTLLEEEKALIQSQLKEYVAMKILSLGNTKQLLEGRLTKLYENMVDIPQMWVKEQVLELKKKLNISMMEAMTQLIESKNVDLHFTQVESKPIDLAYVPLRPKNEHEWMIIVCLTCIGGCFYLGLSSLAGAFKGLPMSLEGLEFRSRFCVHELQNQIIHSEWGSLSSQVMEGIRKIGGFILSKERTSSILGVLLNKGSDYVPHLARILTLSGKKVLIIPLEVETQNRYREIYQKESQDAFKKPSYDIWLQKNLKEMAIDMLLHPSTKEKLEHFRQSYDVLIVVSHEGAMSAIAQRILFLVDELVMTVSDETLEELIPFLRWEDKNPKPALCFLRQM